jgi:hypothetical protein
MIPCLPQAPLLASPVPTTRTIGTAVKVLGRKAVIKMYGSMKEEENWRIRQIRSCKVH